MKTYDAYMKTIKTIILHSKFITALFSIKTLNIMLTLTLISLYHTHINTTSLLRTYRILTLFITIITLFKTYFTYINAIQHFPHPRQNASCATLTPLSKSNTQQRRSVVRSLMSSIHYMHVCISVCMRSVICMYDGNVYIYFVCITFF